MRRFGSTESFLDLSPQSATLAPEAGIRSNVIVGFPGETEDDLDELAGSSTLAGSTPSACSATPTRTAPRPRTSTASSMRPSIAARVAHVGAFADELMSQRAEDRVGTEVDSC